MADPSFDVVSKIDRQEVDNALNQAAKELSQRFDFRGVNASIDWSGELGVTIKADSEERAKAALEVFKEKLVKRSISLKALGRRRAARRRGSRPSSAAPWPRESTRSTPRRSPSWSATRDPRASRPRSRATNCASPARSATTCRRSSRCSRTPTSASRCSSPTTGREGHHPGRRRRHPAAPDHPGGVQAAAAGLRQADDLLPAVGADAGRDPGHPGDHHPGGQRGSAGCWATAASGACDHLRRAGRSRTGWPRRSSSAPTTSATTRSHWCSATTSSTARASRSTLTRGAARTSTAACCSATRCAIPSATASARRTPTARLISIEEKPAAAEVEPGHHRPVLLRQRRRRDRAAR